MSTYQAVILAIVQGITEPFPVSSLGHAVLLPAVLHWHIDEHSPLFLPFLTMLHVGTLLALASVFWNDWKMIFLGLIGRLGPQGRDDALRMCILLAIATLPAVIVGGLFEHRLRQVFATPLLVAGFLVLNGFLLLGTEWLLRRARLRANQNLDTLMPKDAFIIGCWQCLALLPGLSRSGATINGGLTRGLDHLNAARFSLLMAQPIILAASVKESWQIRNLSLSYEILYQSLLGALIAGFTAWLCSKFLLKFFHHTDAEGDTQALAPFGIYCIIAGCLAAFVISR
ncbi:undecaprenyl-diphosphate phosphatase [Oecophyllibacter saccharovorans]|uniref:Undecaprenyl-diphosphatase n=1 Tax=Oecophyllibacter saccharovorans TaxID=2558360 RepID=A0A506UQW3_9PROT|nr:undecaprenyl-diphosphate phosphatase [Oecophyllibacter saccharovorans]TPW34792.1 undecaprenyl-diphosphate phosphatase [Oecophyllibacter saccharovorans]TPW35730.1 undecaprenyl-diphosphate phosphatase [Oecophyllibacter saccharovorans]